MNSFDKKSIVALKYNRKYVCFLNLTQFVYDCLNPRCGFLIINNSPDKGTTLQCIIIFKNQSLFTVLLIINNSPDKGTAVQDTLYNHI